MEAPWTSQPAQPGQVDVRNAIRSNDGVRRPRRDRSETRGVRRGDARHSGARTGHRERPTSTRLAARGCSIRSARRLSLLRRLQTTRRVESQDEADAGLVSRIALAALPTTRLRLETALHLSARCESSACTPTSTRDEHFERCCRLASVEPQRLRATDGRRSSAHHHELLRDGRCLDLAGRCTSIVPSTQLIVQQIQVVTPYQLFYSSNSVFRQGQVWRLIVRGLLRRPR